MSRDAVLTTLQYEEGLGLACYLCPADKLTIGFGHNIEANPPDSATLLRWLLDGISAEAAYQLLAADLSQCIQQCRRKSWVRDLPEHAKWAVVLMVFQMGMSSVLGFRQMILALERNNLGAAAAHALDSKWAREDSPERAKRVAALMRTGEFPSFWGSPAEVPGVRLRDALTSA